MGDLISREELKEDLGKWRGIEKKSSEVQEMNVFEKIKQEVTATAKEAFGYMPVTRVISESEVNKIINRVEKEYNNGWILCSEQLPEDNKIETIEDYMKQLKIVTNGTVVVHALFEDGKFRDVDTYDMILDDVIAWQSLPEPFKLKGENHG